MEEQCSEELGTERLKGIFERVCDVEASVSAKVKIVEVTVRWQQRGQYREVILKTLTRGNGL
jgi:hypothetical protein